LNDVLADASGPSLVEARPVSSLLPGIESLGLWGYWVIGLMTFLEALVLTSVFSPGTVVVVLGGALAAQGIYDIGDMMWFVAIGTILGSQASFWIGRKGTKLFGKERSVLSDANLERGRKFFAKYGGASIVIGHFLGPLRPVAPVVAGLSGMDPRQFIIWNVAGGSAYAIAMVSFGYFFGTAFSVFGASTTRVGLFLAVVLAVLLLVWFLISRLRRSLPFVISVLGSVTTAIRDNPDVQALVARHPNLFRFLAARVSRQTFAGLPATLLAIAFLYFLSLYAESVLQLLGQGPLVQADTRLANFISTVRSDSLTRFFTTVTGLGYWWASIVVALAATVLMWVWHRRAYIPALWITLAGNVLTVSLLKLAFARARPDFALYVESSYAFPSGHSAAIAALSVFLTYVLVRERIGHDLIWILSCFTLVFLVGLSRLYLDEHFLSDVLNGYLVGVLWAIIGIFLAEKLRMRWHSTGVRPSGAGPRWATAVTLAVTAISLGFILEDYSLTLRRDLPSHEAQIDMPVDQAFAQGVLPARSESLIGTPQEPVSIIFYVQDDATLIDAMAAAGWRQADPPGVATLSRAAVAAWLDRSYETAPITPVFWNGWPQDFGFQKAAYSEGLRQRHHVRFWRVRRQDAAELQVFVGTASFDVGIKWGLTHRIDPNVDAERDFLVADLLRGAAVRQDGWAQVVAPMLGQNVVGDPFFTDGRAAILSTPNATDGLQATE
jgi:undecaprenyl-diphosphatase